MRDVDAPYPAAGLLALSPAGCYPSRSLILIDQWERAWMYYFLLAVIGAVAGSLGAMLGIGGSIILIPALNELRGADHQHLHQAAAMIINFFVAAPATWRHSREGAVRKAVIRATIPTSIIFVIVGVRISEASLFQGPRQVYLAAGFGVFMLVFAALNARRVWSERSRDGAPNACAIEPSWWRSALYVGVPTGLIAGLLGVGGGLVAVPLQQSFLRIPLRQAIGNSAATVCGLSLIGAASKNYAWALKHSAEPLAPLLLAAIVLPTVVLGSLWGGRLTHQLPTRVVRAVLVTVLIVGGLRQITHAFSPPG